jgi:protein tyrosine phosphatase (PTP) superfamily phosphohydrolase (DUF442 family)
MITMKRARMLQLIGLAVSLALPLAPDASEARQEKVTTTTTGRSFATRADQTDIPRFAHICPGLTRGGEPSAADLRYLRAQGYKTIVSFLDNKAESALVVESGMKYVNIPMHSGPFSADPPTDEQVRQFLAVAKDSTQFPMFIHCHAGKDRTGAMSAIYRMEVCGWTSDEAIQEMRAFGFAGRYKRLFNYVKNYSPRPDAALVNADSKSTEAKLPVGAELPADNTAP